MIERYAVLDEALLVGSAPTDADSVAQLAALGARGLVSLQTDADLQAAGLRWPVLWQLYVAQGVHAVRVPIADFDKRALSRALDAAVAAIAAQLAAGRKTYVHCTAGLNRSPTAVIAFAVRHRGLSVEAATRWLLERHPAQPYPDVLRRWAKRAGLPL